MIGPSKRWNLLKFSDLDSTNETALEWLKRNPSMDGSVILAQTQRKGRGQRGTQWQDSAGKSLLMTLVVQPKSTPLSLRFSLNMLFSVSVVDALRTFGVLAELKWPNDIVLNRKKVGGILIETGIRGENISHALMGLGLNLYRQEFEETPNAGSVEGLTGIHVPLDLFLDQMEMAYNANKVHLKDWEALYPLYFSKLIGRTPEKFVDASGEFTGHIVEVEPSGHVVIQKESGEKLRFDFKEIQFVY
jgi:BirA family biotin operon repressor/biotin-[acetyl-CoA-carboxylase] ligase